MKLKLIFTFTLIATLFFGSTAIASAKPSVTYSISVAGGKSAPNSQIYYTSGSGSVIYTRATAPWSLSVKTYSAPSLYVESLNPVKNGYSDWPVYTCKIFAGGKVITNTGIGSVHCLKSY